MAAAATGRTRGGGLLQEDTEEKDPRRQRPASMSSVSRFSGALSDLRTCQQLAIDVSGGRSFTSAHRGPPKHEPQSVTS